MIVASRTLQVRMPTGQKDMPIELFAPMKKKAGAWECRYDVGWPEGRRSYSAWGVDSVQALSLALGMIGAELYTSEYHKSGRLVWDKPGNGYGFPLPPTLRDLLAGDDASYF
jgi:hypothetical protein